MHVRRLRHRALVLFGAGLALTASACGGESNEATATGNSESEESIFVGFSNPTAQNTYLGPLEQAIGKRVEALGGRFSAIDAKVDPNKQISDIQTLITQGVDVLIVYPLDPRAVAPVLEQAKEKDIKIIGFNADVDAAVGEPPADPYLGQVFDGFLSEAFAAEQVKWVSDNVSNGKVLYEGLGVPVPALERHANLVIDGLKEVSSLEFVGRVDSKTDDITAAVAPVSAALTKNPDLKAIVTYSDAGALGAAAALQAAGKTDDVLVVSSQLQDPGIQALKEGKIDITYDYQNIVLGVALADMAMDAGRGGDEHRTTLDPGVKAYTIDNIDDYVGWQQQLDELN